MALASDNVGPSPSAPTKDMNMTQDTRCCGSDHCMIDETGTCWCGQKWDGENMCMPVSLPTAGADQQLAVTDPE
jgi:hypothetical protein